MTGDMLLVYPEEKGYDKETINDEWATTSNWVYYTMQSKDDTFMTITILGAMFESDKDIKVGGLLTVKHPEYLLVTKWQVANSLQWTRQLKVRQNKYRK